MIKRCVFQNDIHRQNLYELVKALPDEQYERLLPSLYILSLPLDNFYKKISPYIKANKELAADEAEQSCVFNKNEVKLIKIAAYYQGADKNLSELESDFEKLLLDVLLQAAELRRCAITKEQILE